MEDDSEPEVAAEDEFLDEDAEVSEAESDDDTDYGD